MSEKIHSSAEHHEVLRDDKFFEEHRRDLEKAHERTGREPSHEKGSIESILDTIEKHAVETDKLFDTQEKAGNNHPDKPMPAGSHLKAHGYNQTMKRVQKSLPPTQRRFSKVVHAPMVETASEVVGNTLARPSGLLVGGICSVLVNLLVIGVCRYYGFEYNYTLGLMGFVGGFVLGLILELVYRTARGKTAR